MENPKEACNPSSYLRCSGLHRLWSQFFEIGQEWLKFPVVKPKRAALQAAIYLDGGSASRYWSLHHLSLACGTAVAGRFTVEDGCLQSPQNLGVHVCV